MKTRDRCDPSAFPSTVKAALARWAVSIERKPPWVVVGLVKLPDVGWTGGILAFAADELAAHRIKRAFAEYGDVYVRRTRWHADGPTCDIAAAGVAVPRDGGSTR